MRNAGLLVALLGSWMPGCESEEAPPDTQQDAFLDPDVVTSIPEGDASGDAFTGAYQTRAVVISCAGACGPVEVAGTQYAVCERDAESVEWVSVLQEDGKLRVDLDDDGHIGINLNGYVPVRLNGGIDADGRWDVGGYDTKFGDALESTARARGTAQSGEPLEGTLEVHSYGLVGETEVDCHSTHRLTSVDAPE